MGLLLLQIPVGGLHGVICGVRYLSVVLDAAAQGYACLGPHRKFKLMGLPAIVGSL